MIKITKNPDIHEYTCRCGCEFTFENEDVKYEDVGWREPDFEFVIYCPYCNDIHNLKYQLGEKNEKDIAKRLGIDYAKHRKDHGYPW